MSPLMEENYFLPTLPYLLTDFQQPFIHRDLSWLQFNERVLTESRTAGNPLLERAKFLAITAANLDEFFAIRFASLVKSSESASGERIRRRILETVAAFSAKQEETLDIISSELGTLGIRIVENSALDEATLNEGHKIFQTEILPKLDLKSKEAFSLASFRKLTNLQWAAIVVTSTVTPTGTTTEKHWIEIPNELPLTFVTTSSTSSEAFVYFLDDLLKQHLAQALNQAGATQASQGSVGVFRITRDGDFSLSFDETGATNIHETVRKSTETRDLGRIVRLQYTGEFTADFLRKIPPFLRISPTQLFYCDNTLCIRDLWNAIRKLPPAIAQNAKLSLAELTPRIPEIFSEKSLQKPGALFEEIKKGDVLLHHPYDSFESYIRWMQTACDDPLVTSIQQTVYRMDSGSPLIDILKRAAKTKRVRVLIELRARFDEINNLKLATELEKAGATVAFGFGGLKLHAKLALVTRREGPPGSEQDVFYSHLATGNYNTITAKLYEDLSIFTADPILGADVAKFFDSVAQKKIPTGFKRLVSAPTQLHKTLMNLIDAETANAKIGRPARVIAKVNALVDPAVIQKLYAASQAGVKIDLIVRGPCSVVPGVKGLSQNIRVVSIVDRYLEHSRIYYFASSQSLFLSSADWMPRNFFSRLEIAFPVLDPVISKHLVEVVLPAYLLDSVRAQTLTPQGTWKKCAIPSKRERTESIHKLLGKLGQKQVRTQFFLESLAQIRPEIPS